MALVRPPPGELNPPSANEISTDDAEQFVLLEKPEKERVHQLLRIPAKFSVFLILAICYLTFCIIVRYRIVPIGPRGVLGVPFLHLISVNILIVYVALWPMKSVIDEIKAEEFFRLMNTHPNGVPFDRVIAVLATTADPWDIALATYNRQCSPLLTLTLVISLMIAATTSVAPVTLSAGSIWLGVDNSTFLIGALPNGSFVDVGPSGGGGWSYAYHDQGLLGKASTMAWVENFLNLTNGYYKVTSSEEDQFEYLVPFPPGYTSTTRAQWITDVIVLNPTCSWQTVTATATGPVIESDWNVTLPESNLGCRLGMNYQLVSSPVNTTKVSVIMCSNTSAPEFTVPVDGSVLLMIDQLNYPDSQSQIIRTMSVDFSSIPTLELPTGNVLAFLLCSPHVSIQTYPVLATGNGSLTLGPQRQRSQGNINFSQANYLLSYILRDLPNNSGPTSNSSQVGTDLIQRLIFGTDVVDHSYYMPPAPLTNITAVYKQVIHSAVKTVLSGAFGTANVPGGYSEEQMVFTSSLGHVITSVILFAFLTIAGVAAQLRKGQVAFTWANVAAALADSDVLQKSVEMMQVKAGMEERKVLKLVPGGDGRPYCVYESID